MSQPGFDPASTTQLNNDQMIAIFFDGEWDKLADEGFCDARGGAEYSRLSQLWIREGANVENVRAFITIEANYLRWKIRKAGGTCQP